MIPRSLTLGCALGALALATPAQQTIRVELDYMEDQFHSHRPERSTIDAVVQMFACRGVTLIVDIDDAVPHVPTLKCTNPGSDNFWNCNVPGSFKSYKDIYFDSGSGWHYAIFAHRYDDGEGTQSSGLGEIGGNDFLVADGVFTGGNGTPFDRAATFAHELGHNLGLRHYAPSTPVLGRGPYAPNFASIMSYQYQLRGVKSRLECLGLVGNDHLFKELDYSDGRMPRLQEFALNETVGVGIRPVDWDCDGQTTSTSVFKDLDELNANWCSSGAGFGTVYDYDEWSNITSSADAPLVAFDLIDHPVEHCISPEESDALADAGSCPVAQPILSIEPCTSAEMSWVVPSASGTQSGKGDQPYGDLEAAVFFSPPGSVLYLQPGTHTNPSGQLLINKRIVLAGAGGALIDP